MRDPYGNVVATRAGPELWRAGREGVGQALAALRCDSGRSGVRAGWVWSRERM